MDNKVIRSIVSIAALFLINWIARSIFYSFIDGSSTLDFVARGEWIIAGGTCILICMINDKENSNVGSAMGLVPILATVIGIFMPFSMGLVILYNLVLIGTIIYVVANNYY